MLVCGCLVKGYWLGEQKVCICVFVYLCRCSIEQSKGGGRSKRGHCAICSSNTLTAAKCALVTMVVLKLPVQSRARSRELSVFTVQAFVKIMFLRYLCRVNVMLQSTVERCPE